MPTLRIHSSFLFHYPLRHHHQSTLYDHAKTYAHTTKQQKTTITKLEEKIVIYFNCSVLFCTQCYMRKLCSLTLSFSLTILKALLSFPLTLTLFSLLIYLAVQSILFLSQSFLSFILFYTYKNEEKCVKSGFICIVLILRLFYLLCSCFIAIFFVHMSHLRTHTYSNTYRNSTQIASKLIFNTSRSLKFHSAKKHM